MATISSIDNSIALYNQKIEERKKFIENSNALIVDAQQASNELINASDNLALGLNIGGRSIDDGKFSSMSITLKKNISNLQNSIRIAEKEMITFSDRIVALQAERRRLIEEERAAAAAKRREDADNNRSSNGKVSDVSKSNSKSVTYANSVKNTIRRNEVE